MAAIGPKTRFRALRSRCAPLSLVVAGGILALAGGCATTVANAQDGASGASFVDNFNTLDHSRWYVSDGWSNGGFQNCTWSKDEVGVSDGMLAIRYTKRQAKDRDYACGEIQTKRRFGYGTYEARMKAVAGSGLNSAFFSYIGPTQHQPWDEIDFEVLGKDTAHVQLNQYISGKGHNEKLIEVPGGADHGFNDYAFVWEKDRLRYFVNGKLVETVTDPSKIPSHAQKIFFSLWGSGTLAGWMGAFSDPGTPLVMQVQRVAFTALGDKCQFEGSVACKINE